MKIIAAAAALVCFLPLLALSAGTAGTDPWAPVQFLVGTWKGDGKAEDATGKGETIFAWEVGHQLLVRRDRTEFAATATQPASTYEALMVIYQDPASHGIEANYFDSGNHVIHYKLAPPEKPNSAQFLSDAPTGPTFRLTYVLDAASNLSIKFEIKPPSPDAAFHPVATGIAHK